MRLIITACTLSMAITGLAQTPYTREKVVEVDTVTTAEVLRSKARKWFVDTFKDANEVIQMDDAATHTIVGKGWTEFGPYAGIHFTIEVACKSGRFRYRIYDVQHKGRGFVPGSTVPVPSFGYLDDDERCYKPQRVGLQSEAGAEKQMLKQCKGMRPEIDKRLDGIAASLEDAMKVAVSPAADDW